MSSLKLRLSHRAERDLLSILQFTYETWDESKQMEYSTLLDKAFQRLLDFPGIGHHRNDIGHELHTLSVERHVIYYRVTETELTIERILHAHQDVNEVEFE